MLSIELFAGCGGLALGLAQAGFQHALVVEVDSDAYATLERNKRAGVRHFCDWPLLNADVRDIDYKPFFDRVDVLAGGPPCQPFSIAGKHLGPEDDRNLWPEALRAVREVRPKAFVFENVRGLLRPAWKEYLQYLISAFEDSEFSPGLEEPWRTHCDRLMSRVGRSNSYRVDLIPINAADFGAPQQRHRIMIVGVRCDQVGRWSRPQSTHSKQALLWSQWATGEYWTRHGLPTPRVGSPQMGSFLPDSAERNHEPWVTVRDALAGLPDPAERLDECPVNHQLRPGARSYPRHTGSNWDMPAKAIKAGDHGVPGGENTLNLGDGRVRYFTLREMARLQGFPDDFDVGPGWKRPVKQIGNAVPTAVAKAFGEALRLAVTSISQKRVQATCETRLIRRLAFPDDQNIPA